ncbi:response regulator transcription factor [Sinisalibacter aestuarii]|uniref:Response regulator n=1 Tax=Sinisalibacter aestuarii TaxID=2949426 RepID=A0ABQ5LYK4_9RHOB|nr:response regulator [Sinisalibacter aestuarii]GKY89485.1 response regulator [Sinisalibacter aestuarii]
MGKRIVLVEDEPNIIEAISFILSREGWEVTACANGETAAATVRKAQPDVVLLDVMLPGRSGYEILKDLRADPDFSQLPVLMLTARGQRKDRELAAALGVTRFMTKPFANAELVAALAELAG